ncbi:hypothetical protein C4569_01340 [Candidatus Parcubacteria bacterium]|nr:MAG: hypothetical protein C4569_01340 [Candidatus Parcubacteria bacterium]
MKLIFSGRPVSGSQRGGRLIGFPTINLELKEIPEQKWGVYFSYIYFESKKLPAISHLGPILTFDEKKIKCETHIISWRSDISPEMVKVKLFKKIRDIKKFSSSAELADQIKEDIDRARKYFKI